MNIPVLRRRWNLTIHLKHGVVVRANVKEYSFSRRADGTVSEWKVGGIRGQRVFGFNPQDIVLWEAQRSF